jgi:hypothetical protein
MYPKIRRDEMKKKLETKQDLTGMFREDKAEP